jgi:feruloyl esterase
VRDLLGPRLTGSFLRYHVVPGGNHANFGTPAFAGSFSCTR